MTLIIRTITVCAAITVYMVNSALGDAPTSRDLALVDKKIKESTERYEKLKTEIYQFDAEAAYWEAYTEEIEHNLAIAKTVNLIVEKYSDAQGLGLYFDIFQLVGYALVASSGNSSAKRLMEEQGAEIMAKVHTLMTPQAWDEYALEVGLTAREAREIWSLY